jgi:hypothetical protein
VTVCPYCAHHVAVARFPWLFVRHDVHGRTSYISAVCVGSRNIYTLSVLGLRQLEPEHIPQVQRGAA